jgi:hypothetical protein
MPMWQKIFNSLNACVLDVLCPIRSFVRLHLWSRHGSDSALLGL